MSLYKSLQSLKPGWLNYVCKCILGAETGNAFPIKTINFISSVKV